MAMVTVIVQDPESTEASQIEGAIVYRCDTPLPIAVVKVIEMTVIVTISTAQAQASVEQCVHNALVVYGQALVVRAMYKMDVGHWLVHGCSNLSIRRIARR